MPRESCIAWLSRRLFEPAASVVGAAMRRKSRLLSIFQFTHVWIFAGTAVAMRHSAFHALQTMGALTTTCAATGTLLSYGLSRTRYVDFAAWSYLLLNLAVGPALILLCPPEPGAAFIKIAFVLISVSLTNFLASARLTLICALVGVASTLYALLSSTSPPTAEELRPAIVFFVSNVLLLVVFGIHRDAIEADRSAELRARNSELEGLRNTLEHRIAARTAELSSRNAQMRLVLDNVVQGLFTVDDTGVISSEYSAVLTSWFGPVEQPVVFWNYFARISPAFGDSLKWAWQQVVDGELPLQLTLAQMPNLFGFEGHHYRFSFEPVKGVEVRRFLVVVSDVSSEFERAAAQREKQEAMALFDHMLADRSGFLVFFEEGSQIVSKILSPATSAPDFARAVHTLKGNTTFYGIESVATLCREIEERIADRQAVSQTDLVGLDTRWGQVAANVDRLVGERRHVIEISPAQHGALEQAVRQGQSSAELLQLLQDLKLEPVERRLQQMAEQARQIAERLNKQISVEIDEDGLRLDRRKWAPLWAAFVHAVRNAVDHGIEAAEERAERGKTAQGTIILRARRDGQTIRLELEDDGRGIDWDAVRERCAARGIMVRTSDELVLALFSGGVSTASSVTDISGRGVGMGALHAVVVELGGQLDVESTPGRGTRLRLTFPESSTTLPVPVARVPASFFKLGARSAIQ